MKKLLIPLISVAALASFQNAVAVDTAAAEKLFSAKACVACHAVDRKLVGPSYQEVAAKRGDDVATVAQNIISGSAGVYGPIPMPPNAVTEEEATILAEWILSHK